MRAETPRPPLALHIDLAPWPCVNHTIEIGDGNARSTGFHWTDLSAVAMDCAS
jgi:hypothetical protein